MSPQPSKHNSYFILWPLVKLAKFDREHITIGSQGRKALPTVETCPRTRTGSQDSKMTPTTVPHQPEPSAHGLEVPKTNSRVYSWVYFFETFFLSRRPDFFNKKSRRLFHSQLNTSEVNGLELKLSAVVMIHFRGQRWQGGSCRNVSFTVDDRS